MFIVKTYSIRHAGYIDNNPINGVTFFIENAYQFHTLTDAKNAGWSLWHNQQISRFEVINLSTNEVYPV